MNTWKIRWILGACLGVVLFMVTSVHAASTYHATEVPATLAAWQDWVMFHEQKSLCTPSFQDNSKRFCVWPSALQVDLLNEKLLFSQQWFLEKSDWVPLIGDQRHWPKHVTVDDGLAAVVSRRGLPYLFLTAGHHSISGEISWQTMPASVSYPTMIGLLEVANHVNPNYPVTREAGKLWLQKSATHNESKANALTVRVFRLLSDAIPQILTTRIELNVSGEPREVTLKSLALPDLIPISIKSALVARIDKQRNVIVQLKPGKWTVAIRSRFQNQTSEFAMPAIDENQPAYELWSYKPMKGRQALGFDGQQIDPSQTDIPKVWKRFSAFRLTQKKALNIRYKDDAKTIKAANQLNLNRDIWLDFNGHGATYVDKIHGVMKKDWRLNVLPGLQLGRGTVKNRDVMLTKLNRRDGIELRGEQLDLTTVLRQDSSVSTLFANGYDQRFDNVNVSLHLPPAWRLLHVSGSDSVYTSMISQWDLFDVFIVLILVAAISKLKSKALGFFALLTLLLTFHEPNAPVAVLFLVILALTFEAVDLTNKYSWVKKIKFVAFIVYVMLAIPFLAQESRLVFYPYTGPHETSDYFTTEKLHAQPLHDLAMGTATSAMKLSRSRVNQPYQASTIVPPIDNVQTGPGVPSWSWKTIELNWTASIASDEMIHLWLIAPSWVRINHALNVLFTIGLGLLLYGIASIRLLKQHSFFTLLPFAFILLSSTMSFSPNAQANYPPRFLLDEFKSRLLQADPCFPNCADLAELTVDNDADILHLNFQYHSLIRSVVPLPGDLKQWLATDIQVDGRPVASLLQLPNKQLGLALDPGVHQVTLSGLLPNNEHSITLPLMPHRVINQSQWQIIGLRNEQLSTAVLQIKKLPHDDETSLKQSDIVPFVIVERTFKLNRQWQIETLVKRVTPLDQPSQIEISLLSGEHPLTDRWPVTAGKLLVQFKPQQRSVRWLSNYSVQDTIDLKAKPSLYSYERWRLQLGEMWRANLSGISPVEHYQNRQWAPLWRPWPDETLFVGLQRLQPSVGETMTIENSHLEYRYGKRAYDTRLVLNIIASTAQHLTVNLPKSAEIKHIKINHRDFPIQAKFGTVDLPISPGKHHILIDWQIAHALGSHVVTDKIDVNNVSVNANVDVKFPADRWILALGGPNFGPAVMFWGVIVVIVIAALALGRITITP